MNIQDWTNLYIMQFGVTQLFEQQYVDGEEEFIMKARADLRAQAEVPNMVSATTMMRQEVRRRMEAEDLTCEERDVIDAQMMFTRPRDWAKISDRLTRERT